MNLNPAVLASLFAGQRRGSFPLPGRTPPASTQPVVPDDVLAPVFNPTLPVGPRGGGLIPRGAAPPATISPVSPADLIGPVGGYGPAPVGRPLLPRGPVAGGPGLLPPGDPPGLAQTYPGEARILARRRALTRRR